MKPINLVSIVSIGAVAVASLGPLALAFTTEVSAAEVDDKPPPAPTVRLVKDYVTGRSGGMPSTRYREVRLEGKAAGDAKSIVVRAADRTIAETKVRGDGRWEVTSEALEPGKHILKAVAVDKAGNASTPSDPLTFKVTESPGRFDLARLDGENGAELWVQNFYDECMDSSVAGGDLNGDGLSDVVIGGSRLTSAAPGPVLPAILGVLGTTRPFDERVNVPALPRSKSIWVTGTERMRFESSQVVGAGDLNGDGIEDLAIGLPASDVASHPYGGRVAVIYGRAQGFPESIDLADLAPESGFQIISDRGQGALGRSIAAGGDVNGDGVGDLLVSSNFAAYVVFGELGNGRKALHADRLVPRDGVSFSSVATVRAGGDLNGDGLADIVLSSPGRPPAGDTVYVVYGRASLPAKTDLKAVGGKRGFAIQGARDIATGVSAATGFDLNDDGVDDLAISTDDPARPGYVILGQKGEKRRDVDLGRLSIRDGFQLLGEFGATRIGSHVSAAGDVNGDGVDDLLFGTPDGVGFDVAYVVFGRRAPFPRSLDFSGFDGQDGFKITMSRPGQDDRIGCSLVGAGDVNGDGIDDILISGDSSRDPDDRESSAFLLFGRGG